MTTSLVLLSCTNIFNSLVTSLGVIALYRWRFTLQVTVNRKECG